jgi:rhamnosyltransferase
MRVAFVCIAYNSEPVRFAEVLRAASAESDVLVVDNSTTESARARVHSIAKSAGAMYHSMQRNAGIASAINHGARAAFARGFDAIVMLDDDSIVPPGFISRMCESYAASDGAVVSVLGAELASISTSCLLPTKTMMSSGTLVSRAAFEQVGPMFEPLFVDYVDFEWGWRANELGWSVLVDAGVTISHRRGAGAFSVFGQTIHYSSPVRDYYSVRNLIFLTRMSMVPGGRAVVLIGKQFARMGVLAIAGPERRARVSEFLRGLSDGVRNRLGQRDET